MNKSPLAKVLLLILAGISFWSLGLCWKYFGSSRDLRESQGQINAVTFHQQVFQMLWNEATEYGKRNPAMENLLRSLNTPPPSAPATNAKPTTK